MKIKYFEYIVIYLSVLIVCILIGVFGRLVSIEKGADEYTANLVFWICTGFGILAFAIINIFLHELINRILRFFFKNKKPALSEEQISSENFEKIRTEKQKQSNEQEQKKKDIAIDYVQKEFAPYSADEDLKLLCQYITLYSEKEKLQNVIPIKVKELSTQDLYHFGWNIWKHFGVSNQMEIASFLKNVFADSFKDVEVESIKKHLKDDERKGIIIIKENLFDH